jgi:hypothetical protein
VYAQSGKKEEAQRSLRELHEISKKQYISPIAFAGIYVLLGEKDQAFEWLEKGYQERSTRLEFLKAEPKFDPLRDDPRFKDLLRRVGLPQ